MNKKLIAIMVLADLAVVAALFFAFIKPNNLPEVFHEHADFALFLNGEKVDFSKPEFMSVKPCTAWIPAAYAHEAGESENLEDAIHLHDNNGGVIHLHRAGLQVHDFFDSLGMRFSDQAFTDREGHEYKADAKNNFRFILNGKEVPSLANTEIHDLDRFLISYGRVNRKAESLQLEWAQVSGDACLYSDKCPSRGVVPVESCGKE